MPKIIGSDDYAEAHQEHEKRSKLDAQLALELSDWNCFLERVRLFSEGGNTESKQKLKSVFLELIRKNNYYAVSAKGRLF